MAEISRIKHIRFQVQKHGRLESKVAGGTISGCISYGTRCIVIVPWTVIQPFCRARLKWFLPNNVRETARK